MQSKSRRNFIWWFLQTKRRVLSFPGIFSYINVLQ